MSVTAVRMRQYFSLSLCPQIENNGRVNVQKRAKETKNSNFLILLLLDSFKLLRSHSVGSELCSHAYTQSENGNTDTYAGAQWESGRDIVWENSFQIQKYENFPAVKILNYPYDCVYVCNCLLAVLVYIRARIAVCCVHVNCVHVVVDRNYSRSQFWKQSRLVCLIHWICVYEYAQFSQFLFNLRTQQSYNRLRVDNIIFVFGYTLNSSVELWSL